MYHYIRDYNEKYPHFNFLSKKNYLGQLNKFKEDGIITQKEDLMNLSKNYIFTFDDGFKDHLYAADELKKIGAIGIFFISTYPIKNKDFLDVHKTHLITGKMGGKIPLETLYKYLKEIGEDKFLNNIEKKKFSSPYANQKDTEEKKEFKKIINYCSNLKKRSNILNYLLKFFNIDESPDDFYLNEEEIKYLSDIGMIIGSHSVKHTLLSRLNINEQEKELRESKEFIETITKKECDFFCYPYGGKNSYDQNTLNLLKKLGYKFSFSVDNRDINKEDLLNKPLELPRYDCNQF